MAKRKKKPKPWKPKPGDPLYWQYVYQRRRTEDELRDQRPRRSGEEREHGTRAGPPLKRLQEVLVGALKIRLVERDMHRLKKYARRGGKGGEPLTLGAAARELIRAALDAEDR